MIVLELAKSSDIYTVAQRVVRISIQFKYISIAVSTMIAHGYHNRVSPYV